MSRIVAVLASHERRDTTLAALAALRAQRLPGGVALDVVLVDDGSRDGTAAAVRARFPDTRIIEGTGTLYWGGAMKVGLEAACDLAADHQLWLNDDVQLDESGVAHLLETAAGRPDGIVVGAVLDPDDGRPSYGGQRLGPGWHPLRLRPVPPSGRAESCDTFQGNCVLVPRAVARALGGIDAAFVGVQGMGDTDYGLRARRRGIPVLLAPRAVGTCRRHRGRAIWRDPVLSLAARLRAIAGPKGTSPRAYRVIMRRHGGPLWPLWWALPTAKAVLQAAATGLGAGPATARPRVALLEGVVPDYRLDCLTPLAGQAGDLDLVCYHGQGLPGVTAAPTRHALPLPERRRRNLYWPWSGGRVAWFGGTLSVLAGGHHAVLVGHQVHNLAIWALWLARLALGRPRLVVTGHVRLVEGLRGRLQRLLLRGADAVLPYTAGGAAQARAAGVPDDRVFVLNSTLDTAAIRARVATLTPADIAATRVRLGLPDQPLVLFIGRLYAEKRVDVLVAAVRALQREGRACSLLVVGDGAERARLEQLADRHPDIRFVGPEPDHRVLGAYAALATALVLPDAVGLACVHGFALGLPVVSARRGRHHGPELDFIVDGENGVLVDDVTPSAFTVALRALIDDPARVARLREGCARSAAALSAERMAAATLAGIRRALEPLDDRRGRPVPGLRPRR